MTAFVWCSKAVWIAWGSELISKVLILPGVRGCSWSWRLISLSGDTPASCFMNGRVVLGSSYSHPWGKSTRLHRDTAPWVEKVWALIQEWMLVYDPGRCLTETSRRMPWKSTTGSLGCLSEGHTGRLGDSWMLPGNSAHHLEQGTVAEAIDIRSTQV